MKHFSLVNFLEGQAFAEVRSLQEKLFELTGSQECLKHWEPHLTVGNGVSISENDLDSFEKNLTGFTEKQNSFPVILSGFGTKTDRIGGEGEITTPYVLWIDVQVNEALKKLVQNIKESITNDYNQWYKMPEPYTPHVTVAFRDLTEEGFNLGREYLKKVDLDLDVSLSHIALVERQPDSDIEYKRFYFG